MLRSGGISYSETSRYVNHVIATVDIARARRPIKKYTGTEEEEKAIHFLCQVINAFSFFFFFLSLLPSLYVVVHKPKACLFARPGLLTIENSYVADTTIAIQYIYHLLLMRLHNPRYLDKFI